MREHVQLAGVVDLQSAHQPEECPARSLVDAVRRFDRFTECGALRAVHTRIQHLHQGESAASERLDHFLGRVGEHAEHEPAYILECDVAEARTHRGARRGRVEDHGLRIGQEKRLLIGNV